jgi:DHA1 family bicyclomycin/chloramphenicol resistance-like MFS transporter
MSISDRPHHKPRNIAPGIGEFIVLTAALMAAGALAIDSMLPALPSIGATFAVTNDNSRQLIITFYLLGFGGGQMLYGPLSDRFGRKPILALCLASYALFSLLTGLSGSFAMLLGARLLQGVAAAGTRVLVVSMVRDQFDGPTMARIMSLSFILFMVVPVLAPAFGEAVLAAASWRAIFFLLALYGLLLAAWLLLRLPETHPSDRRRALSLAKIREAVATTLHERVSIGNTLALTLVVGALFAFINSIQQIVFDIFERPDLMALIFASIAGPMAITSYLNSRIVERIGSRRIMLAALCAFAAVSLLHLILLLAIGEHLILFIVLQALAMASFGLASANLNALAMQPLGHIAGTASSVQGTITTIGGALIGLAVGQWFDGTTLPLVLAFAICGVCGLLTAVWANPHEHRAPAG